MSHGTHDCGSLSCQIPFGNDVIYARDGEADNIDCGIGTDKAIVDPVDTVANCETVQSAGGGGDTGPAGGGHGRADRAGTATAKLKLSGKVKRRFKRLRKATVTVRVTVQLTSGPAHTSTRKLTLKR